MHKELWVLVGVLAGTGVREEQWVQAGALADTLAVAALVARHCKQVAGVALVLLRLGVGACGCAGLVLHRQDRAYASEQVLPSVYSSPVQSGLVSQKTGARAAAFCGNTCTQLSPIPPTLPPVLYTLSLSRQPKAARAMTNLSQPISKLMMHHRAIA